MARNAKAVVLFAGAGGTSLGTQQAGFDVVGAFEYWDKAADIYERNFSHPVYREDLANIERAVEIIKKLNPGCVFASPPCQDFSTSGKRIEGERADLTEAFAHIIIKSKVPMFVMENVPNALRSKAYSKARELFKQVGYGLTEAVLDASYYGVPQARKRLFVFGALGAKDGFLADFIEQGKSKQPMTMRDFFGDSLGIECYYYGHISKDQRSIYGLDEPAPTMTRNNPNMTSRYEGNPKDACHRDTVGLRKLTTAERARVQTFPEDFSWVGSNGHRELMIANAVPPKLGEFVARAVLAYDRAHGAVSVTKKTSSVSREQVDAQTVHTVYKSGNKEFVVKSSFIGGAALEDLLFEAIKRTHDNRNTPAGTAKI